MSPRRILFGQVVIRTALVVALAYLLLNLGIAIRKNYTINLTIHQLKSSIAQLQKKIDYLNNQLVYFQSNAYRELELKRRLGLKRKGEQAILVPSNVDPKRSQSPTDSTPSLTIDQNSPIKNKSFFETASLNAKTWIDWLSTN